MNKGLFGSYFEEYFLCFLCFQDTKNLLGEKCPHFLCSSCFQNFGLVSFLFFKTIFCFQEKRKTMKIGKGFLFSFSFFIFLKNTKNIQKILNLKNKNSFWNILK